MKKLWRIVAHLLVVILSVTAVALHRAEASRNALTTSRTSTDPANFDPTTIAGMFLWVIASTESAVGDGNVITPPWTDASSQGNDLAEIAVGNNPTYRAACTGFNGRDCIDFDGGDWLADTTATGITVSGSRLCAGVVRGDTSTGGTIVDYGGNAFFGPWISAAVYYTESDLLVWSQAIGAVTILDTTRQITWVKTATGGLASVYFDGTLQTPTDVGTIGADVGTILSVGLAKNTGLNDFWGGRIGELICYSPAPTDAERVDLQDYLKARFATP